MTLLALLLLTAGAIAWVRQLFPAVMLAGIYGLLSAIFGVAMDAVDVAFTEAAVGAGVTPLLLLATLKLVGQDDAADRRKPVIALLVTVITGVLLILATLDMPAFGDPEAPAHQHVAPRYLNDSYQEIGIPNAVTSVLASYRAFDTLGEVVVVFVAGVGVMSLLLGGLGARRREPDNGMQGQLILRVLGKFIIPPILIFALYVQFHGEYSPGGGFQAGVIFAAAFILYTMLFGLQRATHVVSESMVRFLSAVGLLLFGVVGVISLLGGYNYLDYTVLLSDPIAAQHMGIILIELGVGITVASVMILLFYCFVGRVGDQKQG